jgi:mycothiol synthase
MHPGPGRPAAGEAAWLEVAGYEATEWEAWLVRSHLEDIPDRRLPEGVELRPVTADQIRPILAAHFEAFRGEWDFRDATETDFAELIDDPNRDETLWKIAWVGETVVGQVKSYINHEENVERGYLRGYTEFISTHHDWRGRGIAGALLAMSLQEVKDRGMSDAALGVDTNNPGGAFQLYTGLGFELQRYEAVYTKPVR